MENQHHGLLPCHHRPVLWRAPWELDFVRLSGATCYTAHGSEQPAAEFLLSSLVCSEEDEASNCDPTNAGSDSPEES